ncbi:MAG: polyribonucleotide nucleotidyltransferase [Candidatus Shapirobacteria bacterium]
MDNNKTEVFKLKDKEITFEIGNLALQSNASVIISCGGTAVLVTAVASRNPTDLDYFPLNIEYIERLYAGGIIKGSRWVKKEGRPSDESILSARLIDRFLRPLFPSGFKNEVQVVVTLLSVDHENDSVDLSLLAASAAIHLSDIPWNGPVGVVRVGAKNGSLFAFPTEKEKEFSDLDLVVASGKQGVVMLEAGAEEIDEEKFFKAVEFGVDQGKLIIDFLDQLREKYGSKKMVYQSSDPDPILISKVEKEAGSKIKKLVEGLGENKSDEAEISSPVIDQLAEITEEARLSLGEEAKGLVVRDIVQSLFKKKFREMVLGGKRVGGRGLTEIRPLSAKVGILSRTHGSATFQRGFTKVLSVVTLGAPSLKQLIESPAGEESKRYIHHYFMPPYSVGETGRMGGFNRREIGHGALAERALLPVIPNEEKFPYTIRVVSEVMSSNGSTSMASVCGSTLALMDAGVPISAPVAGISIGMISLKDDFVLLTDIAGQEDFNGDMDFKVAGTQKGICAVQVDIKTEGLSLEIISQSLKKAKTAREQILEAMHRAIDNPRSKLSVYAPKIIVLHIKPEKIGTLIGPGGKTIRRIIEQTQCEIDVEDDGSVTITGVDQEKVKQAVDEVDGLTREVKVGEELPGEVKRIQDFGAFVEFLPGREGLVHVSRISSGYISHPSDVLKIGQNLQVRVREIDQMGRVNLEPVSPLPGSPNQRPERKAPFDPRRKSQYLAREQKRRTRSPRR